MCTMLESCNTYIAVNYYFFFAKSQYPSNLGDHWIRSVKNKALHYMYESTFYLYHMYIVKVEVHVLYC